MKTYVYLFHVEQTLTDDTAAGNTAWGTWFASLGDKLVDSGSPFNAASEAQIRGGVVSMTSDDSAGYTIVKAGSLEEAVEMAKTSPFSNVEHCWVGVHETSPM